MTNKPKKKRYIRSGEIIEDAKSKSYNQAINDMEEWLKSKFKQLTTNYPQCLDWCEKNKEDLLTYIYEEIKEVIDG